MYLSDWTPLFNAVSPKVKVNPSNPPEFIVKFTQKKGTSKFLGNSASVRLYDSAGEKIGQTSFYFYINGVYGGVQVMKRFHISKPDGECKRFTRKLDYLYDLNFELKTAVGQGDMFQFTTSDGAVHKEEMSDCQLFSAWQDVLKRTKTADFMLKSTSDDFTTYIKTQYKVLEY